MRFRSSRQERRRLPFFGFALIGVIVAGAPIFGSLVTSDFFVVSEDDPIIEDVYVTSRTAIVDGTIEGDLTIFTGSLTINGEVTGNVQVFSAGTVRVNEGGRIGGSLRGAAVNITISGEVGADVFASAASIVIEDEGAVGRDVIAFGGVLRVEGDVGRDVRGRTARTVVDGSVGGDIDVATQKFELGPGATVSGDLLYRSPVEASIGDGAEVSGTITRLPTQSNFVYSVILTLVNLVGFLGFLLAGLASLMLLRASGSRATGAVLTKPIRSLLYGLIAVVVAPVAAIILAATLVGIPLAVLVVLMIVAGFVVGPVPAIAALGNRVLFRRGGLLGAFVVGAVLWRFGIWAIPVFGGVLYIVALVWGIGAWIVGFIDTRRDVDIPLALLPASMAAPGGVPDDWTPPFAPGFVEEEPTDDAEDEGPSEPTDEQPEEKQPEDDGPDIVDPVPPPAEPEEAAGEDPPEPVLQPEPEYDESEPETDDFTPEAAEPDSADSEPTSPEAHDAAAVDPAEAADGETAKRRDGFETLLGETATNAAQDPTAPEKTPDPDPDPGPSDDWGLPKR